MKFLCVCNHGNCRSYAMARILKYSGHEAIAIGLDYSSPESVKEFMKWANYIVWLSEKGVRDDYFFDHKDKFFFPKLGRDRWGNPFNKELNDILINYLKTTINKELNLPYTTNESWIYNIYGKSFDWWKFGQR